MVERKYYEYKPEIGKLPGQSFEEQTEDFLNDLSARLSDTEDASNVAKEAKESADKALSEVERVGAQVSGYENRISALEANDVIQDSRLDELERGNDEIGQQLAGIDKDIEDLEKRTSNLETTTSNHEAALENKMDRDFSNVQSGAALDVEHGGTGATSADQALENLGISKKLIPSGGTAGQVLTNLGDDNYFWANPTGGGGGGTGGDTQPQAVLYLNAESLTLTKESPTQNTQTNFSLGTKDTVVNKIFKYTPGQSFTITALETYGVWLFLSGLKESTQYRIDAGWMIETGSVMISSGAVTFTANGTDALIFVPMNVNFLDDGKLIQTGEALNLKIGLKFTSDSEAHKVMLNTGPDNLSAFVRNGGEISATNVYDSFDGKPQDQSTINSLMSASIKLAQNTAEQALEKAQSSGGGHIVIGKIKITPETPTIEPQQKANFNVEVLSAFDIERIHAVIRKGESIDTPHDDYTDPNPNQTQFSTLDAFLVKKEKGKYSFEMTPSGSFVSGNVMQFREVVLTDELDNQSRPAESDPIPFGITWKINNYHAWERGFTINRRGQLATNYTDDLLKFPYPSLSYKAPSTSTVGKLTNNIGNERFIYNGIYLVQSQDAAGSTGGNGTTKLDPNVLSSPVFRSINGVEWTDVSEAVLKALSVPGDRSWSTRFAFYPTPYGIIGVSNYGDVIKTTDGLTFEAVQSDLAEKIKPLGTEGRSTGAIPPEDTNFLPCGNSSNSGPQILLFYIPMDTISKKGRLVFFMNNANNATSEGCYKIFSGQGAEIGFNYYDFEIPCNGNASYNKTLRAYSDDGGVTWSKFEKVGYSNSSSVASNKITVTENNANIFANYIIVPLGKSIIVALSTVSSAVAKDCSLFSCDGGKTWSAIGYANVDEVFHRACPEALRNVIWKAPSSSSDNPWTVANDKLVYAMYANTIEGADSSNEGKNVIRRTLTFQIFSFEEGAIGEDGTNPSELISKTDKKVHLDLPRDTSNFQILRLIYVPHLKKVQVIGQCGNGTFDSDKGLIVFEFDPHSVYEETANIVGTTTTSNASNLRKMFYYMEPADLSRNNALE